MSDKIIVNHGYISVPDYEIGDCPELERRLSYYDSTLFKSFPIGYFYDEESKELRIPSGVDPNMIKRLTGRWIDISYVPDKYSEALYVLKTEPRNSLQRDAISFIIGEGSYENTKKYSQLSLVLETGEGKTYCVIAALSILRMRAIVISETKIIRKQWTDKVLQYTRLKESDILVVDSGKIIDKILQSNDTPKYKFYNVIHRTIMSYAKTNGWDKIREFFKRIEAGVAIFDEAHKEFKNTVRIITNSNFKKYLFVTANFKRGNFKENTLYQTTFKTLPKYIQKERTGKDDAKKHISGLYLLYNSNPSTASQLACKGHRGFDIYEFAKYQVESDRFMLPILSETVKHFIEVKGCRIFIFISSIDACNYIQECLSESLKGHLIGVYHSKVPNDKKQYYLDNAMVIVTTFKSLGTGADKTEFDCVINLEYFSSDITANQMSGRLRKEGDRKSYFIELINMGFEEVKNQYKKRRKFFSKKFGVINIIDKN